MLMTCAKLCQESYDGKDGFTDADDLRFGVFERGDRAVCVFRGSANVLNWMRDLAALPAKTRDGHYAHSGFVGAAAKLWPPVTRKLSQAGKPVVFTGHSLGGAIAVLFAEALYLPAVTFGCPRVWWSGYPIPDLDHTRVVCDDDPVPLVPHLLFEHDSAGKVVTLEDGGCKVPNPEDHFITHYIERLRRFSCI